MSARPTEIHTRTHTHSLSTLACTALTDPLLLRLGARVTPRARPPPPPAAAANRDPLLSLTARPPLFFNLLAPTRRAPTQFL